MSQYIVAVASVECGQCGSHCQEYQVQNGVSKCRICLPSAWYRRATVQCERCGTHDQEYGTRNGQLLCSHCVRKLYPGTSTPKVAETVEPKSAPAPSTTQEPVPCISVDAGFVTLEQGLAILEAQIQAKAQQLAEDNANDEGTHRRAQATTKARWYKRAFPNTK